MARRELFLILVLVSALICITLFSDRNLSAFQQVKGSCSGDNTAPVKTSYDNYVRVHSSNSTELQLQRVPIENVSWVGRQFFLPDPYKIYRPKELEDFFSRYPTLWIGDSTMRRAYLTLHLMMKGEVDMLDIEKSEYLNVNKKWNSSDHNWQDEYCSRFTNATLYPVDHNTVTCRNLRSSVPSDFIGESCLSPFLALCRQNSQVFANYRIVVLSFGLHDLLGRCPSTIFRDGKMTRAERIIARRMFVLREVPLLLDTLLATLPNDAVIAWRTTGYNTKAGNNKEILIINDQLRRVIRTNYTRIRLVDWGRAVYPRSTEEQRIVGDNHYHYGHEARILFLQMLANLLMEKLEM